MLSLIKIFLSHIFVMPLGFDHHAIGFAAVIIFARFARRWIGEAESEPRGQLRLALRIDFLNVNPLAVAARLKAIAAACPRIFRAGSRTL